MTEYNAALYVKKNDPRCEQAIKAVKNSGLLCDVVDVVKTGAINYMHRDLGTSEVPVLCVDDGTIAKGLDSIKSYLHRNEKISKYERAVVEAGAKYLEEINLKIPENEIEEAAKFWKERMLSLSND